MVRANLFQKGNFKLHSGSRSHFIIDCRVLTDGELAALVGWVAPQLLPFDSVYGIPTGGERFAQALIPYFSPNASRLYIVDDVYTTGESMEQEKHRRRNIDPDIKGLVIFARKPPAAWVKAIWTGNENASGN